jgi:signal transduction histidine kinase
MHFYVCFFIPIIAGIISFYKGNYTSIFYILGWSFVFLFLVLNSLQLISISPIYTIHLVTPIESLIFSFALGYTLKKIVEDKNKKEKLLIHNSKLASMGEMINNIAHQWRQPLTHLGFINMNLQLSIKDNHIDINYLKEKIEESKSQLSFMSNTIDNFRDFYKIDKEKNQFFVSVAIKSAINIMHPILIDNKINLDFIINNDKQILAYENEYSQVILNILTNAKDALVSKEIKNPSIKIVLDVKDTFVITKILDNAGGIEEKYIDTIFEPYFTTKQKGSGIGLYMSKMIIESHFKGKIEVLNVEYGALFKIRIS